MNRELLLAALRVLQNIGSGSPATPADIDLLKSNTLPLERDLDLDDLARGLVRRTLAVPAPLSFAASPVRALEEI